jgi:hypothetical protein
MKCKPRTNARHHKNGLGAEYNKAAAILPVMPTLNFN